jgi:glycosyltransferase involved in cell wall biosynthesis
VRFSLIVPTISRTRELDRFLASLERQRQKNFELIVVDQNPDDRLVSLLSPYTNRLSILHLRSEKKGASRARNIGLRHASGDVVAFPDDDCLYPPDLLSRVTRILASRPEIDGLTGRLIDKDGQDSSGRFDARAGDLGKISVWTRAIEATVFLREECVRELRFDESLGVGAGTAWGAGEVTDYLLRLLNRGKSLQYDPELTVIHRQFVSAYDEQAARKAFSYGCGMGRVLRMHKMPLWFKAKWLVRPLGGAMLSAAALSLPKARFRWCTFRGRLKGLLAS